MTFLRRGVGKTRNFLVNLGDSITISTGDVTTPFLANSAYRVNTNGTFQRIRSDSTGILTQPATVFSVSNPNLIANTNFYVRASLVSGVPATVTGTLNTWQQTNAARQWHVLINTSDLSDQVTLRIEMSTTNGGYPVDVHDVTLIATTGGSG